jgi:uncharacterized protein YjbJ (UPF0337 family)
VTNRPREERRQPAASPPADPVPLTDGVTFAQLRMRASSRQSQCDRKGYTVDSDRVEGKAKETEGELQQKWGEAKDKAGDAWEDVKDKVEDIGDDAEDRVDEHDSAESRV